MGYIVIVLFKQQLPESAYKTNLLHYFLFAVYLRCINFFWNPFAEWVSPEKIHTPTTKGMLENLTGGGVNGSGNPDGRGALNLKIHRRG